LKVKLAEALADLAGADTEPAGDATDRPMQFVPEQKKPSIEFGIKDVSQDYCPHYIGQLFIYFL